MDVKFNFTSTGTRISYDGLACIAILVVSVDVDGKKEKDVEVLPPR